jgi:ribosomal protein S18 acetylase RimI-like enzyme
VPAQLEVTTLPLPALDEAVNVQARAFFDDPLFAFVFPDDSDRRERVAWVMRMGVAYGCRYGHVETTAGMMLGHAVWLLPGDTQIVPERLAEAGFTEPERYIGEDSLARFSLFMEQVASVHEHLIPEPHWYLMVLGVDPPYQGQGVGSTIIQSTLARADMEGRRCYLETAKPRNVAFYRKHGFEVVDQADISGGGLHIWMMARAPRPSRYRPLCGRQPAARAT